MGNRAVITTKEDFENNGYGIYMHWNGGRDSVEAFLEYFHLIKLDAPSPKNRDNLTCYAKMYSVISNFLGDSVSFDTMDRLDTDNFDNGTYIIDDKFNIVDRKYFSGIEQHEYSLNDMLLAIDEVQPVKKQLSKDFLEATNVPLEDLQVGDEVFIFDNLKGFYSKETIVGFGDDQVVNGSVQKGVPFIGKYYSTDEFDLEAVKRNPNNYLSKDHVKDGVVRLVNKDKERIISPDKYLGKGGSTTSKPEDLLKGEDKEI